MSSVQGYNRWPVGAVRYRPIIVGDEVVGYLWASAHAAGALRRRSADRALSLRAHLGWNDRLTQAHQRRLDPQEALRLLADEPVHAEHGRLGDLAEVPDFADLEELANPGSGGTKAAEYQRELALKAERERRHPSPAPVIRRPPGYPRKTDSPVLYVPVVKDDTVLGFLWAATTDDAAGYVRREWAGPAASQTSVPWLDVLAAAQSEGLSPLRALRRAIGAEELPEAGAVPAGAEIRNAPSLAALRELARTDLPEDLKRFTVERPALLAEGDRLKAEARRLEDAGDMQASHVARAERSRLRKRYIELLPRVRVARCPRTHRMVEWPIDVVDLNGWFWDHDAPARRAPRDLPPTWLAMTGAMRLDGPVASAPFTARPGPGVPFVVPRLLEQPDVRAVIAQIDVGPHTGWPVTYFGPLPGDRRLENLWGAGDFPIYDDEGEHLGYGENEPWPADYDFDLAPWLESGKLLWAAPGDHSFSLYGDPADCPFVGLEGPRDLAHVENGHVRYRSV
ncbi:hypothetical protein [Thermomonospora umbrina]|uniref:Uncharacterized protein n=1 Tax=Thermomonospora umbrina TaxID=111806 RepID=A0A3D9SMS9_9ACTN|nr:hypothetical protein [Thermomonospora umbrina]REE97158.1 hypothetical protein DFJ69_2615 [Thermomonospora umbrina]